MEAGAIVSLTLLKGDEMTCQMVDGSCNPSVISTGAFTYTQEVLQNPA